MVMDMKGPPIDCDPICEHIMMHYSATGHIKIGSHKLLLIPIMSFKPPASDMELLPGLKFSNAVPHVCAIMEATRH